MSAEEWHAHLYFAARHLPGIGGPEGLGHLTPADVLALAQRFAADAEKELAEAKKMAKGGG